MIVTTAPSAHCLPITNLSTTIWAESTTTGNMSPLEQQKKKDFLPLVYHLKQVIIPLQVPAPNPAVSECWQPMLFREAPKWCGWKIMINSCCSLTGRVTEHQLQKKKRKKKQQTVNYSNDFSEMYACLQSYTCVRLSSRQRAIIAETESIIKHGQNLATAHTTTADISSVAVSAMSHWDEQN